MRAAVAAGAAAITASLVLAAAGVGSTSGSQRVIEPTPPTTVGGDLGITDLDEGRGARILAAVGGFGGSDYFGVARLSPRGRLDLSFGIGGYVKPPKLRGGDRGPHLKIHANSVVSLASGKVLVGGYQYNKFGGTAPLLARYRPDGSPDPSFGHRGIVAPKPASEGVAEPLLERGGGIAFDVAGAAGGKVVAVGAQNAYSGGRPAGLVLSYNSSGLPDRSFATDGRFVLPERRNQGYTAFGAVDVLQSGKTLVAGYLRGHLSVLRLTEDGQLDRSFGGGDGLVLVGRGFKANCCGAPTRMVVSRGQILVAGVITRHHEEPLLLARLRADGRLDRSFGSSGRVIGVPRTPNSTFFTPRALAVQDGRILVAGGHEVFPFVKGSPAELTTVIAFKGSGKADTAFGSGGVQVVEPSREGSALSATTLADGSALVGGALYGPPEGQPAASRVGYVPIFERFPRLH